MKRRNLLATMAGSVTLAGCGDPGDNSGPERKCLGDCHLVDDWGIATTTSFGPNGTEISVSFKEPFTGVVGAKIYSDNSGELKGADSKRLNGEMATSFEFTGAWSGDAYIRVEEDG